MSRIRASRLFIGLFAAAIVVASVACDKLNVKYLSGNHHFNRGNALFNEKKYTKAIEEYELAVQNNPELKEAYRYIGESYKSIFQPGKESADNKVRGEKALEALRKAYDIDPDNKDIIYSLADMYDKLRDVANAEQLFLRIIDLEPGNMNNYYIAAEFYKRYAGENKDLKQKAEQMYLRRIETDPDAVQGYAYMANYYDNLPVTEFKDKFDRALEYHAKRKAIEPNSAELYYTIGVNRFNKAYQLQNFLSDRPEGGSRGRVRDGPSQGDRARFVVRQFLRLYEDALHQRPRQDLPGEGKPVPRRSRSLWREVHRSPETGRRADEAGKRAEEIIFFRSDAIPIPPLRPGRGGGIFYLTSPPG